MGLSGSMALIRWKFLPWKWKACSKVTLSSIVHSAGGREEGGGREGERRGEGGREGGRRVGRRREGGREGGREEGVRPLALSELFI